MTRSIRSMSLAATLLASGILSGLGSAEAQQALPTGGRIASGSVDIRGMMNSAMMISQSSRRAIVNWQGFSIGEGAHVDIYQPDTQAVLLNRVTGPTPSTIAGQLTASGQVFLVNPNGIAVAGSGKVVAGGGFVASTLDITDKDFNEGRLTFRSARNPAAVTNDGSITIGSGGYAALIAGQVANAGTITVPMGKVGLGAGAQATLDFFGDGFLQVGVPSKVLVDSAQVSNAGTISVDGGTVKLTAAASRLAARQTVNLSGTIEARSVSGRSGNIILSSVAGDVVTSPTARIDASGKGGENGGRVSIGASNANILGTIDVSGAKGGLALVTTDTNLFLGATIHAKGQDGTIALLGGHGAISFYDGTQFYFGAGSRLIVKADVVQ